MNTKEVFLLIANIALLVGFVLFAVLHVVWMIYIWKFDAKWKFAQAMQKECGKISPATATTAPQWVPDKNLFELDTVRWNMNKTIMGDRTVKSLMKLSIGLIPIYLVAIVASWIIIGILVGKTMVPLTTGMSAFFERMQSFPASAYYSVIAFLILIITFVKTSKYYGRNPRVNKLSTWMKPYQDSLINVKNTMTLIKDRAPRTSTQFDREQDLQEKIAQRIVMVQNAESKEMGAAMLAKMNPKDMIGYLQFTNDLTVTSLCRYVKEDFMKFSDTEKTAFRNALNNFITNVVPRPLPSGTVSVFEGSANASTIISSIYTLKQAFASYLVSHPYLYQYIDSLNENNVANFVYTWWEPALQNGTRIMRPLDDENVWDNVITPKICASWKSTWQWDSQLADLTFGDPSPKLKPMMRDLKIYFAITFAFVASILYLYVPKGVVLPLAFASLLLVFLFAYLTQYM